MPEDINKITEMLQGTRDWASLEIWAKKNKLRLYTADQVKQVVTSRLWYEAFLGYYWAIAERNYRRSTHQGRPFDAETLRDIKADIRLLYFEAASDFAAICEWTRGRYSPETGEWTEAGCSLIDLKDYLCLKLGPRAKHDPKVPDFGGLTQVPRLKGQALEKAVNEEERRLGRVLTKAERAAIARWPVTAFVAADQEGGAGNEEGGNAHDWLDILKDADPAWTDGHVSALEGMISQQENDAFRQIMLDVMRKQAATVREKHGPVVWEAVIRYAALRAKGENYGKLPQLCADLGVRKKTVEGVLENLSHNLVSAIVRKRPDLADMLRRTSRENALREIARRNGPRNT